LICFLVFWGIIGWILIGANFALEEQRAYLASGKPVPEPGALSVLSLVIGAAIGLTRFALLAAAFVAMLAGSAQRFHDLEYSGWAVLWLLIPVINLYFFFLLFFRRGTAGANQYGPDPLLQAAPEKGPDTVN
jgi:uncharacterized membrane protein YhaH (DUF805 family)